MRALPATADKFFDDTHARYPYAFGILRSSVRMHLDGLTTAADLAATLDALNDRLGITAG